MKKKILCFAAALLLTLTGCAPAASSKEEGQLTVVATTYPVYLLTSAVTDGVEGVTVERLNTGETSCLHDYTLSVSDMKKLEGADVLALNGVGLEDFMEDALATTDAAVIDCSQGVDLLFTLEHEDGEDDHADHDHDHGDYDPHIWMDPGNAIQMVENLMQGMSQADPDHAEDYQRNGQNTIVQLQEWDEELAGMLSEVLASGERITGLITFHDGFQYFANAYDLPLLAAIEEESGSEASAKEIVAITNLVEAEDIPVIFTEVNGSDATAKAIARETGCQVAQLTMVMDGSDSALTHYWDGLRSDMQAVIDGFAGGEGTA
jgi:ABC-type Zn uptake system ZnuABC Zn-binding protein ZnuA